MPATVWAIENLAFRWPERPLFSGLCAHIPPGVTWLGGGEQSGKTTLLRLLAGDLKPQSGHVRQFGPPLTQQQAPNEAVFWMDPRSQVFETLAPAAYWAALQKRYPAFDARLLAHLRDGLGLTPHKEKALYMLSTGSKRKVWLAGAFASGATLTLLDEPFAALDKVSIDLVLELLQEAATHPARAWVLADYVAPRGVPLAARIALGE